jgi:hypothetical protein
LVDSDVDLLRLFTATDEHTVRGGPYIAPHTAGGVQLWGFGGHLITKAWVLARFEAVAPTVAETAAKLDQVLQAVRRVARGKGVDLPARVGLAGVLLPEDFEPVQVGSLRIRRSDERDEWLVAGTTLTGSLGATSHDGEDFQIDYAGNIVLETTTRYRVKLTSFEPDQEWPSDLVDLRRSLEVDVEDVRLALALGQQIGHPASVIMPSWIANVDLLGSGMNMSWHDTSRSFRLQPRRLDAGETSGWCEWIERVRTTPDRKRIEIAIRRLLMASGERLQQDDVLIDAVIVWENLFGAKGESGLRITGSLAALLVDGPQDRMALRAELAKIYDLRSNIVHGSAQLTYVEQPKVDRALEIARDALRALFADRTDLIALPTGAERSTRLLMGG